MLSIGHLLGVVPGSRDTEKTLALKELTAKRIADHVLQTVLSGVAYIIVLHVWRAFA